MVWRQVAYGCKSSYYHRIVNTANIIQIAEGQRGTYLSMLDHAGMFETTSTHLDIEEARREPARAWEEWKELESRHRYVLCTVF